MTEPMTAADIVIYAGYVLTSFGLGYMVGLGIQAKRKFFEAL